MRRQDPRRRLPGGGGGRWSSSRRQPPPLLRTCGSGLRCPPGKPGPPCLRLALASQLPRGVAVGPLGGKRLGSGACFCPISITSSPRPTGDVRVAGSAASPRCWANTCALCPPPRPPAPRLSAPISRSHAACKMRRRAGRPVRAVPVRTQAPSFAGAGGREEAQQAAGRGSQEPRGALAAALKGLRSPSPCRGSGGCVEST